MSTFQQEKNKQSKKQYAYQYFINKGYRDIEAAAIVGNLDIESGFSDDVISGSRTGDSGRSVGLAQWNGERRKRLNSMYKNPNTIDSQLDFIDWELKNTHKGALNKLKSSSSLEEATSAFTWNFERPNKELANFGKRLNSASQILGIKVIPSEASEVEYKPSQTSSPVISSYEPKVNLDSSETEYTEPEETQQETAQVEEAKQDINEKSFLEDFYSATKPQEQQVEGENQSDNESYAFEDPYNYIDLDPNYNFEEFQRGGIIVNDKNDPRYKAYQDSLYLYTQHKKEAESLSDKNTKLKIVKFNKQTLKDYKESLNEDFVSTSDKLNNFAKKSKIQPIGEYRPVIKGGNFENTVGAYKKPLEPVVYQKERIKLKNINSLNNEEDNIIKTNLTLRPEPIRVPKYYRVEDQIDSSANYNTSTTNYQTDNLSNLTTLSPNNTRKITPMYQIGGRFSSNKEILKDEAGRPIIRKGKSVNLTNNKKQINLPKSKPTQPLEMYLDENSAEYKNYKEREAYFHPKKIEGIKSGNEMVDFVYNHDWLIDTPIIGDYIKQQAKNIASKSAGHSSIPRLENIEEDHQGYDGSSYQSLPDKPIKMLEEYFNEDKNLDRANYTPTSDYFKFLPTYSVKKDFDSNYIKNKKGYREMFGQVLNEEILADNKYNDLVKNKKPVFNNQDESSLFSEMLGVDLGGHKMGAAWDSEKDLPYISISDAWDFEPTQYSKKWGSGDRRDRAYIQSYLLHKSGHPFKVYDRFYFDPKTKKYIPDEEILKRDKKTSGYQQGGAIVDPKGQWAHPGEVTIIPGNNITMEGVDYPVLGIDNLGNSEMMMPGEDYKFKGEYVTEYPQIKKNKSRFI